MRIIASILSIIILVVSFQPCMCKHTYNENELANHMSTNEHACCSQFSDNDEESNNHNHHSHEGHCSPFCVCGCCTTAPLTSKILQFKTNISYFEIQKSIYNSVYNYLSIKSHWHPPN